MLAVVVEVLAMDSPEETLRVLVETVVVETVMVEPIHLQMVHHKMELPILVVEQEEVLEVLLVQQLLVGVVDLVLLLLDTQPHKLCYNT